MPHIPVVVRVLLALVGFAAVVAAMMMDGWAAIALSGVSVLGFTTSIDWRQPVWSAIASAVTGFPMAVGFMAALELAGVGSEVQRWVGFATVAVFIVTGFLSGAVAGYTLKTVPRKNVGIALGGAAITLLLMVSSLLAQSSSPEVVAPGPPEMLTEMTEAPA